MMFSLCWMTLLLWRGASTAHFRFQNLCFEQSVHWDNASDITDFSLHGTRGLHEPTATTDVSIDFFLTESRQLSFDRYTDDSVSIGHWNFTPSLRVHAMDRGEYPFLRRTPSHCGIFRPLCDSLATSETLSLSQCFVRLFDDALSSSCGPPCPQAPMPISCGYLLATRASTLSRESLFARVPRVSPYLSAGSISLSHQRSCRARSLSLSLMATSSSA